MFKELDVVALTHTIKKYGLSEGRMGTIVQLYNDGETFSVEFIDSEGYTITILDLTPKDVCLAWRKQLHKDITYSDRSSSKNKDEEWNWTNIKYLKTDKTIDFTDNYQFI